MRKKLIAALFATLLGTLTVGAQGQQSQRYLQYIEQYKDVAIEQMLRWKIPASITLAQGLLESGAGQSDLAVAGNNHFGIKCHGWEGRTVHRDDDARQECFRAYNSAYESFEDHSRFLASGQRYRGLFKLKTTDYEGWARGLKAAGYATNPQYAQRLIDLIELYRLDRYDRMKSYDKSVVGHSKDRQEGASQQQQLLLHPIYMFNKNYYLYARRGDTFRSIGEEIGVSYKKIARYNERDKDDRLQVGEVVWLKKKQSKAPKTYKHQPHVVQRGESMYSIAQKYGIRLKSLYKLNHLTPDYNLKVGDVLRVR